MTNLQVEVEDGAGLPPSENETIVSISLLPLLIDTSANWLLGPAWMIVAGAGLVMTQSSFAEMLIVDRLPARGAAETNVEARARRAAAEQMNFIVDVT